MNLQVTELKIGNVQAAQIEWNGAEIKASLELALEDYRNAVVTEETMQGYKKVMAELNKQAEAIDEFRKGTVKQLNPDIKKFESEAKELTSMIKEARAVIADQVEVFIEKQREEKKSFVNARIDALQHEFELETEFFNTIEFKDQYLNSSMTLNKAEQDLRIQFESALQLQNLKKQKIETIEVIVNTFNHQLEFKFDPKEFDYLLDSDIGAISQVVNEKVQGCIVKEKETRERLEREKQEAIEKAKRDEEERVRREEEQKRLKEQQELDRKHREELRQKEIEKQNAIQEANIQKQEALDIAEVVTEQFDSIVPDESKVGLEGEDNPLREFNFYVLATTEQIEALKCYLDQYDFTYCIEGE